MDTSDTASHVESSAKESSLLGTDPGLQAKSGNPLHRIRLIYPKLSVPPVLPDIEEVLTVSLPDAEEVLTSPMPDIEEAVTNPLPDTEEILTVPLPDTEEALTALLPDVEKILTVPLSTSSHEQENSGLVPLQSQAISSIDNKKHEDIPVLALEQSFDIEDINPLVLKTVSLRVVEKKRSQRKVGRFFVGITVFLCGAVFLGILTISIILVSDILYKLALILIFFMAFSYIASVLLKHMYQAKMQLFFPIAQFVRKRRGHSASFKDDSMKHLKVARQNTTDYLRDLKKKDLKKGFFR